MENGLSTGHAGNQYGVVSFVLGVFCFITPVYIDLIVKVAVGLGSLATAFMACRNYYFNIKKTKKDLRK